MAKKERDFTNMVFGQWTVLYKDKNNNKKWICRCSCGTQKSVDRQLLWNNGSKSCGCKNKKYTIGDKFGKLTIIEIYKNNKGKTRAKCLCECGNKTEAYLLNLRKNKVTTCGCLRTKNIIGKKFGQLLVIEKDTLNIKNNKSTWYLCLCNCGRYCYRSYSNLLSGTNNNCLKHNLIIEKARWLLKEYDFEKNKNIDINLLTICSSTKIWWKCKKCNNSWIKDVKSRYAGSLCPNCIESKGNKKIKEILIKHNIKFECEKRFKECRNIKPLPFDFYLPDYNLCIEYQGKQHYDNSECWSLEKNIGKEKNNYIRNNDNIKRKYCINKQINFLEIKYTKIKIIEKILLNKIKELSND